MTFCPPARRYDVMMFSPRHLACRLFLFSALCCALQPGRCAAPARILLLTSSGTTAPWALQMGEALRGELLRHHPSAELDLEVMQQPVPATPRMPLPTWLLDKYAGRRYDAIVPLVPDQLLVAVALRDRLWQQAAVVAPELDATRAAALAGMPRISGLLRQDPVARNLALMFALSPHARHIAVASARIDGDPIRPNWRAALRPWLRRADLVDLSGLVPDDLLRRAAALSPDTVLYLAAPATANTSAVMTAHDMLRAIAPATRARIFIDVSTLLGVGAIGGWVDSPVEHAHDIASQLNRVLAGVPPAAIGFEPHSPPRLQFDWRALRRAGIDANELPAGSEILFQPPGLWEAYRDTVLAAGLVLVMQSILIGALLLERRRRKHAERQTRQHLGELARLDRVGAVGVLSAALAHEINQPLGAILSNAETAELLLTAPSPPREQLRELLDAIRADNQRAADVLVRLRGWIADSAAQQERLALNPLLHEVARILRVEVHMRRAVLLLDLTEPLPDVFADNVQIQQVTVNLVLNALDALEQIAPDQRRIMVSSKRNAAGDVDVCVADNGPGLSGAAAHRLFEPFFSTKPDGLGVGLSISRSILARHGGTLRAEPAPGGGALFRFTLPALETP
ncbi:ATP-binding protein [Massilia putida]|uniref:ATP-binding protein n=1 Tax=Massilia putida TaxID=1141883 RepID=UPI000AC05CFC|nr:ATP-binding protein [Massilia putida]